MKSINNHTDNARLLIIDVGLLLDVSEKRSGNAGRIIRCFPFRLHQHHATGNGGAQASYRYLHVRAEEAISQSLSLNFIYYRFKAFCAMLMGVLVTC